ncbi:MAG: SOS response-associated peptidase family protein, partial [Leptospira sp.]|nr:SOS response-associated peptidase family protein [Leptospira sp.]
MCNRFNLRFPKGEEPQPRWTYLLSEPNLFDEFIHKNQQFIKPEYKPTDPILNLRIDKSNVAITDLNNINPSFDTWGARPDWSDKPITNSRSEKLFTSPFWKPFITQNRCLIPVSSFFEWQEISGKKHKQEITFKNDSTCLAGLYGNWEEIAISRPGIWITILT